ncbi:MAG: helix-turn-helix transcriptional regulator [Clostridia bacterium]|nr:helix-turn-helix transcriptional regulator [Clostridia bacterium]
MTFGERLKMLRKDFNISQDDLGKKIGVARTSIANYETNRNYPTSEVLEKLSDVFNVSIDYLLCKTDIRSYDKDNQEFRFAYHKEMEGLTEEEVADALRFYKEMKKRVENNNEFR